MSCFEIRKRTWLQKLESTIELPKRHQKIISRETPRRVVVQICIKQPGILSRFTWQFLRLDMSWGTFWKQMQHMKTAPEWLARWKKMDLYSRVPVVSLPLIIPITIIHPSFIAAPRRKGSVFNYSNKQGQHKSSISKICSSKMGWFIFPNFRAENNKKNTWNHQTHPERAPKNQMCHLFLRPHPSRDHTSCSASNFINLSSKGNCFASRQMSRTWRCWKSHHLPNCGRRKWLSLLGKSHLNCFYLKSLSNFFWGEGGEESLSSNLLYSIPFWEVLQFHYLRSWSGSWPLHLPSISALLDHESIVTPTPVFSIFEYGNHDIYTPLNCQTNDGSLWNWVSMSIRTVDTCWYHLDVSISN